jgi:photosystem II stability/assembly factor-like uncharacterized protein
MRKLPVVIISLILIVLIALFLVPAVLFYLKGPFNRGVPFGFQQADLSVSWESMNGPPGGSVYELFQNPYGHKELYATTTHGVYKSEDKGESWRMVSELGDFRVTSITATQDRLFFCGDNGVFSLDGEGNAAKILNGWCNKAIVSGNRLFVTFGWMDYIGIKIMYADLDSGNFNFNGISLPDSLSRELVLPPFGTNFPYSVKIPDILVLGNRILANVIVEVQGSGQYTNGQLFISEDFGKSWSKVELDKEENVIVSNIIQDSENPNHIILTLKHGILHEFKSPLSGLVKESFDGGKTWRKVTDADIPSNGVMYVAIKDGDYYLLNTYDFFMVKLNGSGYEQIGIPEIKEFEQLQTTRPNPNPPTYSMDKLLFDYDDPDIAYGKIGSIWAFGIIKSEDGMKTWKKMDKGIIASSRTIVLPHPTDLNTTFTFGNILQESFATRDGGKTWELFTPIGTGDEVRIDPHDPDHIIAVSESSYIYESFDSGRTFKNINGDFYSAKIFDFEIPEDQPKKLYASNIGLGLSQYDLSQGGDWRHVIGSPDYVYDFEFDPEDSDILYAAYSPKKFENHSSIWRYAKNQEENFGWSELARLENSTGITSLKFDPQNPNKMYAGVIGKEGTLYVSDDKGINWKKLNEDLTFTTIWGHSQLQIDPRDKKTVYAGTWGGGSYKTTDGGQAWLLLDQEHTFSPVCLAVYGKNPDIIYACDRTAPKIHKSTDAGKTWTEYYDFGKAFMLTSAVAIDPDDPDTIYASAFMPPMAHTGGFVKIKNGVATEIGKALPRSVIEIEIDPHNKNTLYAATHVHGVYVSRDGGSTWEELDDKNNGLPRIGVYDIDVAPSDSETLYATALCGPLPEYMMPPEAVRLLTGFKNLDPNGSCGVYKSVDSGANWKLILKTVSEARGIDIDPENPENLYVADMMGGVWVSNDAGQTWRQENDGLGSVSMTSVKMKADYIYASTQGSGVYAGVINGDGSITWDRARSNKPKAFVYKIQVAVDPDNSDRLYASAYPGGLLRSDDGGKHWNDKNFLTPSIKVEDPLVQGYYFFDINPQDTKNLWLGAYGKGMFVSYDGMDFDMFANGLDNKMFGKHITSLKINPLNPDEIYVGAQEGVFVTKDSGKHWEELNEGLQTHDIRALRLVSKQQPPFRDDFEDGNADGWAFQSGWSVADDNGNRVFQGAGHTWTDLGERPGNRPDAVSYTWANSTFESRVKLVEGGLHVNYRVYERERYFLDVSEGGVRLFREKFENEASVFTELARAEFSLGKNTWVKIKIIGGGNNIKAYFDDVLKIDYIDNAPILYGGVAFESLPDSKVYVDDVQVTTDTIETAVYAGTAGYGIYKLDTSGNKWQSLGRTLGTGWWSAWDRRMYQFSSMLFDPDVPGKIYYGHFPSGFFISEDNGRTWKDSSLGLGNDGIFSLGMHPRNHSILFAGTYNGVAKSEDSGRTWKLKSNGMPPEQWPYTVALDGDNPSIMYVSTKNGKNKGFCDRNVFCGVVMKSTDGGESWFRIMNGLYDRSEFYTLLIYPPEHNILFLSTNMGVYISRDAGNSWKTLNSGLPSTNNQVRDNVAENLALTPDNKYLILGLVEYGLWKADLSNLMK